MFVFDKQMNNMEDTSVGQRFVQLINHLGISKNAFAMSLDKTATVIQHLVEERNKPGFDLICKVFEVYPNVSKDWLLQGSGPMLTTPGETPKQVKLAEKPEHTVAEVPAAAVVPATVSSVEEAAMPVAVPASVPVAPAPAESPTPRPIPPEPATSTAESVAPVAPGLVVAPPPAAPVVAAPTVAATATVPDAGAWQTALYTQQMAHQLAMAEMRNQHLQDQQRLMQQMMDLMQRKLA
ncbi:helix-turn-helix transcriptional regulator [Hymenobacter perfusus]|uniref:XRE family transcriptional regulator n=1 Tax=Hymenobacter perfusus TaxID=1236770 RepID=A0A3R9PS21_9BACT|nr:helix-turn-helix transcriptional regulator [Hymenobacter perfusus]RSK44663.1 XRE family transcriptional regulator [Hymenobacter perfusus]